MDYADHAEKFNSCLEFLKQEGYSTSNPVDFIQWNQSKTYLEDLKSAGIEIPKTFMVQEKDFDIQVIVAELKKSWNVDSLVLKPNVSSSSRGVNKIDSGTIAERLEEIKEELLKFPGGFMVQEYIEEVTTCGEIDYVFFGQEFQYAFWKLPANKGEIRVSVTYGGRHILMRESSQIEEIIDNTRKEFRDDVVLKKEDVLLGLENAKIYMKKLNVFLEKKNITVPNFLRVDGIVKDGRFLILELEGIEPYLEQHQVYKQNPKDESFVKYVQCQIPKDF